MLLVQYREMSAVGLIFFKREHIKCIEHWAAQLAGVAQFLQLANNQSAPGSVCI